MCKKILLIFMMLITSLSAVNIALGSEETSLFNSRGKATAYIAGDLTIYLWSGKPVAYLHLSGNKFHLYGFNGKHLGWFSRGGMYDNEGDVFCASRESFGGYTEYEPYKPYKQYKPYKSYKEYAPFRPLLSNTWSDISCEIYLLAGTS